MKGQPRIEVRMDAETKSRIEAALFSPLEQRIPFGRISEWCAEACGFRVGAVELALPEGRLWCDPSVYDRLKPLLPSIGLSPLPGDRSSDF
jgi:hypothetical protein